MRWLTISEAAEFIGVSVVTLRRWCRAGTFVPKVRTIGRHRRYSLEQCREYLGEVPTECVRRTVGYARVSSHDQKHDLVRQAEYLKQWCEVQGMQSEIITDLGSGMNFKKRGLAKLLRMIHLRQFDHLVLTHKDRLLRFGAELVFDLCKMNGIGISIMNDADAKTAEESLASDVIELMTVFSARLHGQRSRKNMDICKAA